MPTLFPESPEGELYNSETDVNAIAGDASIALSSDFDETQLRILLARHLSALKDDGLYTTHGSMLEHAHFKCLLVQGLHCCLEQIRLLQFTWLDSSLSKEVNAIGMLERNSVEWSFRKGAVGDIREDVIMRIVANCLGYPPTLACDYLNQRVYSVHTRDPDGDETGSVVGHSSPEPVSASGLLPEINRHITELARQWREIPVASD